MRKQWPRNGLMQGFGESRDDSRGVSMAVFLLFSKGLMVQKSYMLLLPGSLT